MPPTLGQKLRAARLARGLSLDEAARATKIRAVRLAEIERDILSNCPSLTYARGFVTLYGELLGVDVTPHLKDLEVGATAGVDDYQYLSGEALADASPKRRRTRGSNVRGMSASEPRSPSRRRTVGVLVALAAVAMVLFGYVVFLNYQRLGGDLDTLAARQEGRPDPAAALTSSDSAGRTVVPGALQGAALRPGTPAPRGNALATGLPAAEKLSTPAAVTPRSRARGTMPGSMNPLSRSPHQVRPDYWGE